MELEVGGWSFSAHASGPDDGVGVLALHGFPEGARCWDRVSGPLAAAGCRVVAPDQRGYSRGARPDAVSAYALPQLVADAVGFLDALGWRSAHLLGHDWGAIVAWTVAARHPERVRSLTAVSLPHPQAYGAALRSDPVQQRLSGYLGLFRAMDGKAEQVLLADGAAALRAFFAGSGMGEAEVDVLVRPLREPGALTAALAWYRAMAPEDYAEVPAVSVPTTYVWGTADLGVARAAAEGCAAWVAAGYRFVELDGVSHWVPEEAPDQLAEAVLARVRA
ncbi:MAG: alpha/beta hydrolase [Actinomycetia bacterium]|jgi:pimeloyl-ACP methyl ester carboxylesterase|nr:alpha/beta hydrolase [Actinomycetes bacterium]